MIKFKLSGKEVDNAVAIGMGNEQVTSRGSICKQMSVSINVLDMDPSFKEAVEDLEAKEISITYESLYTRVLFHIYINGHLYALGNVNDDAKITLHFLHCENDNEVSMFLAEFASYVWNGLQHAIASAMKTNTNVEMTMKELIIHA